MSGQLPDAFCLLLWVTLGCVLLLAVLQLRRPVLLCGWLLVVWLSVLVTFLDLFCSAFCVVLDLVSEVLRQAIGAAHRIASWRCTRINVLL